MDQGVPFPARSGDGSGYIGDLDFFLFFHYAGPFCSASSLAALPPRRDPLLSTLASGSESEYMDSGE